MRPSWKNLFLIPILRKNSSFLFETDLPIESPGRASISEIQVLDQFHREQYQQFFVPNFSRPFQPQPQIIFSELYIHLEEFVLLAFRGIREGSSDRILSCSCSENDTLPNSRSLFLLSTVTLQHFDSTHYPAPVSRSSQNWTFAKDLPHLKMLAAVGCRFLLLENQRHRRDSHLLLANA